LARAVHLDTFDYFERGFGAGGDALERATVAIPAVKFEIPADLPQATQRLRAAALGRNEQK
jgi:hypothetical protein